MRRSRILLVALLIGAGCSRGGSVPARAEGPKPGSTPATPSADPSPATLGASLVAELGEPVAIVPSTRLGLLAVSADGARHRVLVPGPVNWALVDNRAQVVWFGASDSIRLLDLASPTPTPEGVVAGLPTEVISGTPGVTIQHDEGKSSLDLGHPAYYRFVLSLGEQPNLTGDPGVWTDDESFAGEVAAVVIGEAARTRLVELWRRGAGRPILLANPTLDQRVPGVDPSGCEEDPALCGQAEAIPGNALWRVTVGFSCGDGCYRELRLYDPATKQFVERPWPTEDIRISADGKGLVQDGAVYRLDGGRVFGGEDEGVRGGGWLGAYYYLY